MKAGITGNKTSDACVSNRIIDFAEVKYLKLKIVNQKSAICSSLY